ncbi:MAG: TIGR02530 family flagellar biosynthesis protein [FCB group bacterium]
MPEIDGIMLPFIPAGGIQELNKAPSQNQPGKVGTQFEDIFTEELKKLKFSAHAQTRLSSREISLSDEDMNRLNSAVSKADEKGANESLVLLDDKAFIVSVPNKTVITVVNNNQMDERIITNIDSAVFA